jgi:hypothetical protein
MTRPRFQYRQSSRMPHGTTVVRTVPTKAEPAAKNTYTAAGGGPAEPSAMKNATPAIPTRAQHTAINTISGGMAGA